MHTCAHLGVVIAGVHPFSGEGLHEDLVNDPSAHRFLWKCRILCWIPEKIGEGSRTRWENRLVLEDPKLRKMERSKQKEQSSQ